MGYVVSALMNIFWGITIFSFEMNIFFGGMTNYKAEIKIYSEEMDIYIPGMNNYSKEMTIYKAGIRIYK